MSKQQTKPSVEYASYLTDEERKKAKDLAKIIYTGEEVDGSESYLKISEDYNDGTFVKGELVGVYKLVAVHRLEKTEPRFTLKGFNKNAISR